jgi:hypothetical protein
MQQGFPLLVSVKKNWWNYALPFFQDGTYNITVGLILQFPWISFTNGITVHSPSFNFVTFSLLCYLNLSLHGYSNCYTS